MHIKSIVLDGFKSYGKRTEVTGFDTQFNAITGLNGSGKSNILDSICFVLGISNLIHVRAASLQDLIYRSGQAGINKATVSITFDNTNPSQCPPGFEKFPEVVVTRQIVVGGKNKYMINGSAVPNKQIQDLFCSVQLNVNNPHFLIMQGKITKVLNMKPPEILAMVEEAAGTRMYEVKRQNCQRLIEKKDAKLLEFQTIFDEEVAPKLKKLRDEREQFLEYQQVERELERMLALFQYWSYYQSKRDVKKALTNLENAQHECQSYESKIKENIQTTRQLDEEIKIISANAKTETAAKLKETEGELKAKEKIEAQSNAILKTIKDNMDIEQKKLAQLKKNLEDDGKVLKTKEQDLENVQSVFETLKNNDAQDNEAFVRSQKKFETVSIGMELNDDGEAQTLLDQFMQAKGDASQAVMESKQASMQLISSQNELNQKQKELGSISTDHDEDMVNLEKKKKEVKALEVSLGKLNNPEDRMNNLQAQRRVLTQEISALREKIETFYAQKPYTRFSYTNPAPNFNPQCIKGVVCNLIKCDDPSVCMALETIAGGKLYNVVADTEATSKKLLQYGNLQLRTTFIPLNKIRSSKIDHNAIKFAETIVGAENCKSALSLIKYDGQLKTAMEFIFGNVFVCTNLNVAQKVAFHVRIRKKCVTLDGDVVDPSGVLSGGAPVKGGSIFEKLWATQENEQILAAKEKELEKINSEIRQLSGVQENYNSLKQKLDLLRQELQLIQQRLQLTTHYRQQEEVDILKKQIESLREKVKTCKEVETKASQKAKEIEIKMKDTTGYRDKRLKEAESELKRAKQKAEKSRKDWKRREQEYETLNLEISDLQTGLESIKTQIETCEQTIAEMNIQYDEKSGGVNELKEEVKNLQKELKIIKTSISTNNKEIQSKIQQKEKLLASNDDLNLKIKEHGHELNKLKHMCAQAKQKEENLTKKIKKNSPNMQKAKELSDKEGHELQTRINSNQIKKNNLGRVVNTKAQTMFEQEEKQYYELRKKEKIVLQDRKIILSTLKDMDKQKEDSLKHAYVQVSKDFGSIFGTLLPGANAKLVPPAGKTMLEGLEVKISLGDVWKESLTELSGGQRSLAALSLILAMLLFKPAPLYILDEVDAALDLSHTQNIGNMLKSHFKKSQFIIVSLKDGMFNNANVLFRTTFVDGVSMITRTTNK